MTLRMFLEHLENEKGISLVGICRAPYESLVAQLGTLAPQL